MRGAGNSLATLVALHEGFSWVMIVGNGLAGLDPFDKQTSSMNSESGVTVRHEDLWLL